MSSKARRHGAARIAELGVQALVFDVFGTVVDWRGSLIREGKAFGAAHGLDVNWTAFADAWRAGYRPAMDRVRTGELPWMNIDALHRMILDDLIRQFGIRGLKEADKDFLNRAWHRLRPWREAPRGLRRLKQSFIIGTLSNGNVGLLTRMAKAGKLPWDVILSAELFRHYKPDPESYRGAAEILGLKPVQVMMVAAHKDDLFAARKAGLRTAFVRRPKEFGPDVVRDLSDEPRFDFNADDFVDLADRVGAP
ncbi:MAG: haloacid dehalogenase type II [Burkholderiales bacterium]